MIAKILIPALPAQPGHGPPDDGDNPGDEREDENEAPVVQTDERTEAREEFVVDEELDLDDEIDRRRVGVVEALGDPLETGDALEAGDGEDVGVTEEPIADDDATDADGSRSP